MPHRILIPLEGRLVILPAVDQPQPLLEQWPWEKAIVWLVNPETNTGSIYLGGPPDRAGLDGSVDTTGPVSTSGSEKGYPVVRGEPLRLPGPISELWLAGTAGDVVLYTLFPP